MNCKNGKREDERKADLAELRRKHRFEQEYFGGRPETRFADELKAPVPERLS